MPRFKHILFPIDFSEEAQIDRACALSELGRKQEAEALFQELPNLM